MVRRNYLYFGHPAAIKDDHLFKYFVQTVTAQAVADLADTRCVVVGKKGGGKTALFRELSQPFKKLREVVTISPKSHLLPASKGALGYPQYANILEFEIMLEMLRAYLQDDEARKLFKGAFNAAAWLEGNEYLSKLAGVANLKELSFETPVFGMGVARADPDAALRLTTNRTVGKLRERIREIVRAGVEFVVLIDDPDLLFGEPSAFVSVVGGLLQTAVDITTILAPGSVKVCVFVKQHKYDFLARKFEDFDHIRQNSITLTWTDAELIRLIAERVRFREKLGVKASIAECWSTAFAMKSEKDLRVYTDYLFPRLTNGPRDLIEFCNLAMTAATESGRDRIELDDLKAAEAGYSRDCLDEVEREYGDLYSDIADVVQKLFDDPKLWKSDVIAKDDLRAVLTERYLSDEIQEMKRDVKWLRDQTGRSLIDVLFKVGVIGIVSTGSSKAHLMSYSIRNLADSIEHAKKVFVHPAYVSALKTA